MMIAPNSLGHQKEGVQEEEEKEAEDQRKEGQTRTPVRRERSYRSHSVRGVGCKEQQKTWTVFMVLHSFDESKIDRCESH